MQQSTHAVIAITGSVKKEHIPRISETSMGPSLSLGELLEMTVISKVSGRWEKTF